MTSLWRHNVSVPPKFWQYSQSLTTYTNKSQKIEETYNFHRIFGKISKEMLTLIHIPSYKLISCHFFVKDKIRIIEFHQRLPPPLPTTLTTPSTPKFRCIFVKRCVIGLVQVTYNRLATFGCQNILLEKKLQGGCNHPALRRRGLI